MDDNNWDFAKKRAGYLTTEIQRRHGEHKAKRRLVLMTNISYFLATASIITNTIEINAN